MTGSGGPVPPTPTPTLPTPNVADGIRHHLHRHGRCRARTARAVPPGGCIACLFTCTSLVWVACMAGEAAWAQPDAMPAPMRHRRHRCSSPGSSSQTTCIMSAPSAPSGAGSPFFWGGESPFAAPCIPRPPASRVPAHPAFASPWMAHVRAHELLRVCPTLCTPRTPATLHTCGHEHAPALARAGAGAACGARSPSPTRSPSWAAGRWVLNPSSPPFKPQGRPVLGGGRPPAPFPRPVAYSPDR